MVSSVFAQVVQLELGRAAFGRLCRAGTREVFPHENGHYRVKS
ncbi:hypothetical protein [Photorhabdus khanii]|nr:hypothetical protein [Photorhabdus khanii]